MPYYEEKVITMITVHMVLLYGRLGKRGAHEKIVDFANFSAPSCRNLTGKAQYRNRHPCLSRTPRAEDLLSDSSQSVM